MNQIIYNLMIVNSVAAIIYFIYLLYNKLETDKTVVDMLKPHEDILEKYNNMKRKNNTIYIIGILIGLMVLIFIENETETPKSIKIPEILNHINNVSDVSDIYVK